MSLDYIVQIAGFNKPLKNGLTIQNIRDFQQMLKNPSSKFYQWCNKTKYLYENQNQNEIIKELKYFYDEEAYKYICKQCCENDVKQNLFLYQSGRGKLKFVKKLKDIPRFLFRKKKKIEKKIEEVEEKIEKKIEEEEKIEKKVEEVEEKIEKKIEEEEKIEKKVEGVEKKKVEVTEIESKVQFTSDIQRLIFLISIDDVQYILKITANIKNYTNEAKIYTDINEFLGKMDILKEKKIKDKYIENFNGIIYNKMMDMVVKIYGSGNIKESDFEKGKLVFEFNENNKIFSIEKNSKYEMSYNTIKGLFNLAKDYGRIPLNYIILEYAYKYDTLERFIILRRKDNNMKDICELLLHIIKILFFLNDSIGFNHWDLHKWNILVKNKDEFKLFDFDQSSTDNNENYFVFDIVFGGSYKNISKKLGILYDIHRLMETIAFTYRNAKPGNDFITNFLSSGVEKNLKYTAIANIIKEIYPDVNYIFKNKLWGSKEREDKRENVLKWYEDGYYNRIKWEIGYGNGEKQEQGKTGGCYKKLYSLSRQQSTKRKHFFSSQQEGGRTYRYKYKKYKYKYDMLLKRYSK